MTATILSSSFAPTFNGPEGQEDMPYLLAPGPLTTSRGVKLAMLADYGARDSEFRSIVKKIRSTLLELAQCNANYECVIMQGPGTNTIEGALGSFCPSKRYKTLVVSNGAYGERAAKILNRLGRPVVTLDKGDSETPNPEEIVSVLNADRTISHLWIVHCETTSGIVNPIASICKAVAGRALTVMVDAMSSFGAIPIDMAGSNIDVMVSSPNKCIEGVPGFSYALVRRTLLEESEGICHSTALDLFEQWAVLERTDQFRFTPPTHALVAFQKALEEYAREGGLAARHARYARNAEVLVKGMREMGIETLLRDGQTGPIIQTFLTPRDPNFKFETFYELLRRRGYAIYPGMLTKRPSFRIGTIGQIDEAVIRSALTAIREVLKEMAVTDMRPLEA